MATVKVAKFTFTSEDGKPVEYERLCITGFVSGELHTLELKLNSSELMLAKMLLSSKEEISVDSRKSTVDEADEFFKKNSGRDASDKIDLNED